MLLVNAVDRFDTVADFLGRQQLLHVSYMCQIGSVDSTFGINLDVHNLNNEGIYMDILT